jgi:uncharacterized protein (TIGR02996 family)
MNLEQSFLDSIRESPGEVSLWHILADWLEERDDPRAELVRLTVSLRTEPKHKDFDKRQQRVQELLGGGMKPLVPTLTNSIGMTFALIPAGSFLMGSPPDEEERHDDEAQHQTTLSRPYYLGIYPATQTEYQAVIGSNPANFRRQRPGRRAYPVEHVSWTDAVAYCEKLTALPEERAAGRVYRLPTEAEWEWACRAGTTTAFHFGSSASSRQACFDGNAPYGGAAKGPVPRKTRAVGSYPPNAWGLYDMHGNVANWCADWDGEFPAEVLLDPVITTPGTYRCVRGGAWSFLGRYCRAAYRNHSTPSNRTHFCGFRVLLVAPAEVR